MNAPAAFAVRSPRAWPAWLVLALGLGATGAVTSYLAKSARDHDEERFESMVHSIHETVETRLEKYALGLGALQDFFTQSPVVTELEWHKRLDRFKLGMNYPGMVEVGYGEIWGADWYGWPPEAVMGRFNGRPMPASTNLNQGRRFAPLLFHASPGNRIRGDYGQETMSTEDLAVWPDAYNGNTLAFTGRKSVPRAGDARASGAFRMLMPVYLQTMHGQALVEASVTHPISGELQERVWADRNHNVRGVVFGTIAVDEFLDGIFGGKPQEVVFEIFDGPNRTRAHWLNDRPAVMRAEDTGHRPYLSKVADARPWSVYFCTTPAFEARSQRYRPWVAAGVGTIFSGLLFGITFGQVNARRKQEVISGELRDSRDQLRVALNDRERLSRDLHDGTIQSIYAVGLGLNRCRTLLRQDTDAAEVQLQSSLEQLHEVVVEVRQFILGLEADARSGHRLDEVFRTLVERWKSGTDTRLELAADASVTAGLDAPQTIHLLNIAREAISNSLQHARAREVRVSFTRRNGHGRLEVRDDGVGFIVNGASKGHGLRNLAVRAGELHGKLTVHSEVGRGTMVAVELPMKPGELTAKQAEERGTERT